MTFTPQGYARENRVTTNGVGEPDTVGTREFRDVDLSANWFKIPDFGTGARSPALLLPIGASLSRPMCS